MHRQTVLILCLVAMTGSVSLACMWDYDTLRDERRGLPGIAELLAGRFEKRSEFFYRDRIQRMQKLLKDHPDDQDAIDNLAVALFRVGNFDRAVATMEDKEKRFPNQYTTASNLATFYMLEGNNDAAIPLLEKALRINANAHFGREKYQLKLAQFLKSATAQPSYPLKDFLGNPALEREGKGIRPNMDWLDSQYRSAEHRPPVEKDAIDAIAGMIRFGTDQSPDLWYALGNLLALRGDQHFSLRAYLRAVDSNHPLSDAITGREGIISRTRETIADTARAGTTDSEIAAERADGAAWAKAYMDFADDLVRAGKNPDDESNYADFYAKHGVAVQTPPTELADVLPRGWSARMLIGNGIAIFAGTLLISAVVIRSRRRRRGKLNAA